MHWFPNTRLCKALLTLRKGSNTLPCLPCTTPEEKALQATTLVSVLMAMRVW